LPTRGLSILFLLIAVGLFQWPAVPPLKHNEVERTLFTTGWQATPAAAGRLWHVKGQLKPTQYGACRAIFRQLCLPFFGFRAYTMLWGFADFPANKTGWHPSV